MRYVKGNAGYVEEDTGGLAEPYVVSFTGLLTGHSMQPRNITN